MVDWTACRSPSTHQQGATTADPVDGTVHRGLFVAVCEEAAARGDEQYGPPWSRPEAA